MLLFQAGIFVSGSSLICKVFVSIIPYGSEFPRLVMSCGLCLCQHCTRDEFDHIFKTSLFLVDNELQFFYFLFFPPHMKLQRSAGVCRNIHIFIYVMSDVLFSLFFFPDEIIHSRLHFPSYGILFLIILVALLWTFFIAVMSFLRWDERKWMQHCKWNYMMPL